MTPVGVIGLGIESSCDETSVALIRNGSECLANLVHSQIEQHAPFRGVVPEIASRAHLEKINTLYDRALVEAGLSTEQLEYVSVSVRPGLVGSLMVGAQFAKSFALVTGRPIIGVDHLEAHLYAPCLEGHRPEFPFLGLLLSGGNSAILMVHGPGQLELLADTLDDACGEAFDKAAAILGLPFPGGPHVERAAAGFHPEASHRRLFPKLLRHRGDAPPAFSFSGIKTALLRAVQDGSHPVELLAWDFQDTVFELVERVLLRLVQTTGITRVVASGGVLANQTLRVRLEKLARESGFALVYPRSRLLCTDNAAMIGALGYFLRNTAFQFRDLSFDVSSKRYLPPARPSDSLRP